jgi:hypothetical protein
MTSPIATSDHVPIRDQLADLSGAVGTVAREGDERALLLSVQLLIRVGDDLRRRFPEAASPPPSSESEHS